MDILETLENEILKEEEEEKPEDIRISCAAGTEYEIIKIVPPHLEKYRIPQAYPYYFHGSWGCALYQKIRGKYGNAWDNWHFPTHDVELSAVYPRPITEIHGSIRNHYQCIFNGTPAPQGKAGQGGVLHARGFHNTTILQAGKVYHNFDVHTKPHKVEKFADDHPMFCDLLNNAANKKPTTMPAILKIDGELTTIIHQLKNPSCAPGNTGEFVSLKIQEYLMSALWQIDRKDPHLPIIISQEEIIKARQAEEYIRKHLKDTLHAPMLAKLVGTNLRYLKIAFKHQFGMTMDRYKRKLRMDFAKILLLEAPGLTVSEIALEVGYNNAKNFSTAFNEVTGSSPTEFRQKVLGKKLTVTPLTGGNG